MASHYLSEIRRVQPSGPYYLGGWSLGGVVAFEIAQQLHCQQEEVGLLVLIDSEAPSRDTSGSSLEMTTGNVIRTLLHNLMIEIDEEKLAGSSEEQQLGMVLEAGKQARRLPADFSLERAWNLLHVFKSNLRARSSYVPQPYPGHILFFRAVSSIKDMPVHLDSRWRELALSGVEVHDIPGNHFTMLLQHDSLNLLANTLKHCLETSQSLRAESKSRAVLSSAQMASHT
jgi:thioesterase domain-containing protein